MSDPRTEFREAVFRRDGGLCVICKEPAADAHHIIERRLFPDGGYDVDNGASLCPVCHVLAEQTVLSCDRIRDAAGIRSVCLPNTLDREENYDKWGNIIHPNGTRSMGELFDDESVQKVLAQGDVLKLFCRYVKFPKIWHLPWSDAIDEKTDRKFDMEDMGRLFAGKEVVVTEKMDGENTTMYPDLVHARSIDGRSHPSRDWVKALHATISGDIPTGWRVCGENLYALHSIPYLALPTFFLVFAIYDDRNVCLPWDDTVEYASMLGLGTVHVLYRGPYDEARVRACHTGSSFVKGAVQEGYVMRLAGPIHWRDHRDSFAKHVRKGHVNTTHNWMRKAVVPNSLA